MLLRTLFSLCLLFLFVSACSDAADDGQLGPADAPVETEAGAERPSREARSRQRAAGELEDRMEAARLESRVLIALADDDLLRPYAFEAEAQRGVVVLRGEVPTAALHTRVDDVAARVSGVRSVVNEVTSDEPIPERPVVSPDPAGTDIVEGDIEADIVAPETATPADPVAEAPAETAETFHTVRSGESLWTIARQYNTSIPEIRRLNNLTTDNLRPGQRIRVR